ncbi:MAG: cation:proton antiporter, partial [Bacteroidetes bacterium]|nr:cation:proton antiporter [Bacteroidota bacterium]
MLSFPTQIRFRLSAFLAVSMSLFLPEMGFAGGGENGEHHLIESIGISIIAATVLAFAFHYAKQPLLLAYIAAGVVVGPIGLHLIVSKEDIETISEIGLILLLFMIGLEIDMKKLKESGKALIMTGVLQY